MDVFSVEFHSIICVYSIVAEYNAVIIGSVRRRPTIINYKCVHILIITICNNIVPSLIFFAI